MSTTAVAPVVDEDVGTAMHALIAELYPICRSITGDGLRETLRRLEAYIPLTIHEVASGTKVLDWTVPREWNIRDAYVKNSRGERVVDFRRSNLHVVNYSVPVRRTVSLAELRAHCFTLPEHPDWIPYRTSYYEEAWGFCLTHRQLQALPDDEYEVVIDSTLAPGHLTYGELVLPGGTTDEILVSCHACHPSLCNDNLSGISLAVSLALRLKSLPRRYSYRFVFIPGTIGAITWLSRNRETTGRIRHGLVLTSIGDRGPFHYKKSRQDSAEVDRAAAHVLKHTAPAATILPFSPYGYDERQYCSPGFNLPVGCLMRSVWGTFPEYHTSADNLDFLSAESLAESLQVCASIFELLENNRSYQNLSPFCESQLGRRGLYHSTGGTSPEAEINARLWVLNMSDGQHSLLDIAERSGLPFAILNEAAGLLSRNGLLAPADSPQDQT